MVDQDEGVMARWGRWEEQVRLFAIVKLDESGVVRGWNAGAESLKGYSADEIVGRHFSGFYRPTDRDRGLPEELLETARRTGSAEDTGWRVRKDGTEFWARVTITSIRDEDGVVRGFVKIVRDLTPEKHAADELTLLQRAFAHDLMSPVTALRGHLELLEEDIGTGNHLLDRALKTSEHLAEMATALLRDASTHASGGDRSTDAHLLVQSAAALVLRQDDLERIDFERLDPVVIRGDILALRRAVANVIENAAKYSDGKIRVSVVDMQGTVEIRVADHGRGIDPEDLEAIFTEGQRGRLADPFDGGSGIGLASVREILRRHHGEVAVASVLGEGTTITLTLPN